MFPYEILPGIDLYVIFLAIAAVSAIISFGKLADIAGIEGRVQNVSIFTAVAAIILGYGSAVLFQAFYNIARDGGFKVDSGTGATFYGGLIGGALCFIVIYFTVGYFRFKDKIHSKRFLSVCNIAAASIVIAHSFGRIGCLMAGCCHGAETDAWYGIVMQNSGKRVVPIQLFEAIFLVLLFVLFVYRIRKNKGYNMPIYMIAYGAWRFVIEYWRDDYRGSTFISFLTPSQLTAIIMIIAGIILIFVFKMMYEKQRINELKMSETQQFGGEEKSVENDQIDKEKQIENREDNDE